MPKEIPNNIQMKISIVIVNFLGHQEAQSKVSAVCYRLQTVTTCQRVEQVERKLSRDCVSQSFARSSGLPQKIYYNNKYTQ